MIGKIKYPIEIEFTNNCALKCISCISKDYKNKWSISSKNFNTILEFLDKNLDDITYVTLGWLWDNLLHKDILILLDGFKRFNKRELNILIPTKWNALTEEIILKLQELKKNWININIQIWIFSLREKVQNFMSGIDENKNFNYFKIFIDKIKYLKKIRLDFSLELLLTKLSENETDRFYDFCNWIGVDGVVHRLHTFWWKLTTYSDLYSSNKNFTAFHCSYDESKVDDENHYYNDKCWFFPYIDWEWNIYPGTFCTHYNIWKIENFIHENAMEHIVEKCYQAINLQNEYCLKCTDNPVNNLKE